MKYTKTLLSSLLLSLSIFSSNYSMNEIASYLINNFGNEIIIIPHEEQEKIARAYKTQLVDNADRLRNQVQKELQQKFAQAVKEKDYVQIANMIDFDKIIKEYFKNTYLETIGTLVEYNTVIKAVDSPDQLIKSLKLNKLLSGSGIVSNAFLNYIDLDKARDAINFDTKTVNKERFMAAFDIDRIIENHKTILIMKYFINADILKNAFNFTDSTKPFIDVAMVKKSLDLTRIITLNDGYSPQLKKDIFDSIDYIGQVLQKSMSNALHDTAQQAIESQIIDKSSVAVLTLGASATGLAVLNSWCYSCTNNVCQTCLASAMPVGNGALIAASLIASGTFIGYRYLHNQNQINKAQKASWLNKVSTYIIKKYSSLGK